jgi:hypothetical protein
LSGDALWTSPPTLNALGGDAVWTSPPTLNAFDANTQTGVTLMRFDGVLALIER